MTGNPYMQHQFPDGMASFIQDSIAESLRRLPDQISWSVSKIMNTPRYQRIRAIEEHVAAECGRRTVR
jgi:hypothetical protein